MSNQSTSFFQKSSTMTLVKAAVRMEKMSKLSQDERIAKAWIYEELESRVGGVKLEDEDRFEQFREETGSYVSALVRTYPRLVGL